MAAASFVVLTDVELSYLDDVCRCKRHVVPWLRMAWLKVHAISIVMARLPCQHAIVDIDYGYLVLPLLH
jgi:hypothetical protein